VSQPFESVSKVVVHFEDGSCSIIKNHGMDANAAISQLRHEIAALQAENERLRKAGDVMDAYLLMVKIGAANLGAIQEVRNGWINAINSMTDSDGNQINGFTVVESITVPPGHAMAIDTNNLPTCTGPVEEGGRK